MQKFFIGKAKEVSLEEENRIYSGGLLRARLRIMILVYALHCETHLKYLSRGLQNWFRKII